MAQLNSMNKNDYKILYNKAEKEKINGMIDKVKTEYIKYEKGAIDFKDLKDIIVNDLSLTTNEKFDNMMNVAGRDQTSFTSLLKSLDILKKKPVAPKFTPQQIKDSTSKRYPKYVRNKTYNNPKHEDDEVQNSVSKFIKRQIDSSEFSEVLRANNINPNVEEIRKLIRSYEEGQPVKYNDLLFSVKKFSNIGIDPSKIKFDIQTPDSFVTHTETDVDKCTVLTSGNRPMKLAKKKQASVNPNFKSNKEIFDWEENEHQKILNKIDSKPFSPTVKQKFVFESSVFKNDNEAGIEKKSNVKKVSCPYVNNGNILKLGSQKSEVKPSEIKRKDPNVVSKQEVVTEKPKRKIINAMQQVSEDNVLNTRY